MNPVYVVFSIATILFLITMFKIAYENNHNRRNLFEAAYGDDDAISSEAEYIRTPQDVLEQLVDSVVVPGRIPKLLIVFNRPKAHSLKMQIHSSDTVNLHIDLYQFNHDSHQWFKEAHNEFDEMKLQPVDIQTETILNEIALNTPGERSVYTLEFNPVC